MLDLLSFLVVSSNLYLLLLLQSNLASDWDIVHQALGRIGNHEELILGLVGLLAKAIVPYVFVLDGLLLVDVEFGSN